MKYFLLLLSWGVVAFGQPARSELLSLLSAAFGFALCWRALFSFQRRFLVALVWFTAVQAIQLSWMTSTHYMGPLILIVYLFLIAALGAQFALLTLYLPRDPSALRLKHLLAMAGCWVWLEWLRLFFLCGFSWNLAGLPLSATPWSVQFAAIGGAFFLSFWVIWTNGLALRALFSPTPQKIVAWGAVALLPYLYGFAQKSFVERLPAEESLKVALVHTSLLPEVKEEWDRSRKLLSLPLARWEKVLEPLRGRQVDLVVFPEGAFPFSAHQRRYSLPALQAMWERLFGSGAPLSPSPREQVSNSYLAESLARTLHADVLIGLDDRDTLLKKSYNAALYFPSQGGPSERYEKRILVPVGEYIPFQEWGLFNDFLAEEFGIYDSFLPGRVAKVFSSKVPLGASICYEETFPSYGRELKGMGARLLVNLSNDVWFPDSLLPEQHLHHGRLRAAENGIPLVRACNRGVTAVIDAFGSPVSTLSPLETETQVLFSNVPLRTYSTLYTFWGDGMVLILSSLSLLPFFFRRKSCPK